MNVSFIVLALNSAVVVIIGLTNMVYPVNSILQPLRVDSSIQVQEIVERKFVINDDTELTTVYIPPGSTMIGTSEKTTAWLSNEFSDYISDVRTFQKNKREFESPVFKATITKGYWIGKYEITNRQWKATIPSTGRNKVVKYPMYPKTNITWEEANQYCKALTELLGVTVRLPTEIEWEYAARSGTEETNDKNQLLSYHVRKSNGPISVTRCLRNNWGVYGMLENVSEWCLDYYAPYTSQDVVDRTIKSVQEDFKRIIRGGNFKYNVHSAIASFRDGFPPNKSDPCIGLRVVILDNPPLNYFQIK